MGRPSGRPKCFIDRHVDRRYTASIQQAVPMRLSRSFGIFVAAFGLIVTADPVAADSRDIDQGFSLSFGPCLASESGQLPPFFVPPSPGPGNDGAFHICFVNIGGGASWEASTGKWILFRDRLGHFGTKPECESANPTATAQVDGAAISVDVSCQQAPIGFWLASFRILSHPLPAGGHSVALTFSFSGDTPTTFSDTLNVLQG